MHDPAAETLPGPLPDAPVFVTGATGLLPAADAAPGEAEMLRALAPHPPSGQAWAQGAEAIGARLRHGEAVNLDPAALILDTVFKLQSIAGGQAA